MVKKPVYCFGARMSLGIGIVKPTKRKDIEGVSTNSLIDLKATLFSAEESVCLSHLRCTLPSLMFPSSIANFHVIAISHLTDSLLKAEV